MSTSRPDPTSPTRAQMSEIGRGALLAGVSASLAFARTAQAMHRPIGGRTTCPLDGGAPYPCPGWTAASRQVERLERELAALATDRPRDLP